MGELACRKSFIEIDATKYQSTLLYQQHSHVQYGNSFFQLQHVVRMNSISIPFELETKQLQYCQPSLPLPVVGMSCQSDYEFKISLLPLEITIPFLNTSGLLLIS